MLEQLEIEVKQTTISIIHRRMDGSWIFARNASECQPQALSSWFYRCIFPRADLSLSTIHITLRTYSYLHWVTGSYCTPRRLFICDNALCTQYIEKASDKCHSAHNIFTYRRKSNSIVYGVCDAICQATLRGEERSEKRNESNSRTTAQQQQQQIYNDFNKLQDKQLIHA